MSVQSTLTNFYNVRKRGSADEVKKHSKVRILDAGIAENFKGPEIDGLGPLLLCSKLKESVETRGRIASNDAISKTAPKISNRIYKTNIKKVMRKKRENKDSIKSKIAANSSKSKDEISLRNLFFNVTEQGDKTADVPSKEHGDAKVISDQVGTGDKPEGAPGSVKSAEKVEEEDAAAERQGPFRSSPKKMHVVFEKMGSLSPRKVDDIRMEEKVTCDKSAASAAERHVGSQEKNRLANVAESGKLEKMPHKELSLSEIRARLLGNRRLVELRESVARVSSCAAKIREADRQLNVDVMPSLEKFQAIEFEVPVLKSPSKTMAGSPSKTPPSSPLPAHQRFSHLTSSRVSLSPTKVSAASPSKGSPLSLPYQYRCLAEVFRCIDVVVSMMVNRKEKITFSKLRPAVQEMLRKNVSERHLGQIKRVLSGAFEYKYEKVNQLTVSSAKAERYELVITPHLKSADNETHNSPMNMTPSLLLERRHEFHKNLLELVKDHHEIFLQSLVPPMVVPRDKLTRWHPLFEVDILPEVEPAEMPQPPDASDKCSSARDVLDKARDLFGCNTRMERALEKVSVSDLKDREQKCNDPGTSFSSSTDAPLLNPALKGIPPALLKKVRERQAAKALMTMTMSPAEEKQAERLSRLPELARVLRGIYVSERKGVLSLDVVLQKLTDSYRASLSRSELDNHLKLLEESVPGWISRCTVRNSYYLKLSKNADISIVISKLERTANGSKQC